MYTAPIAIHTTSISHPIRTGSGDERSPISQNAIPRKSRPGSVAIRNMITAEKNDAVITPASSSV